MTPPTGERAVVVTGASTGIGAAIVVALARAGIVAYAGVRNDVDAARLQALHVYVRPLRLDVTDTSSIAAAARDVRAEGLALIGLVNNAGIAFAGPLEYLPLENLRRQFEVNCIGAVTATQAFLPLLRAHPSRIVFIGSVSGRVPMPYIAPYSASKFALRAIADALRVELRPSRIDVCLVEPGSVATPIFSKGRAMLSPLPDAAPAYYRDAIAAIIRGTQAEERGGMPVERVANIVVRTLTERKPKAHRIVGLPAQIGAALALLPPALHDRFMRAMMRLP
jgi:NAD(P)-dependent dehydrogenase (short-subunit alcohol dehydrogenase family)